VILNFVFEWSKKVGDARVLMRMIGSKDDRMMCGDDVVAEDEDQKEFFLEVKKGEVIYAVLNFIGTRRPRK
jgi:hypothetical protein